MKTNESIEKRRSIRKFKETNFKLEDINEMLKAGLYAPSSCGRRPWEFIVIDDKILLNQIALGVKNDDYNPQLGIAICTNTKKYVCRKCENMNCDDGWIQDCAAAMQNILLQATELGFGSVWIGILDVEERENVVNELLNLPEDVSTLGIAYIGEADEIPEPRTFDFENIHWNKFGVKSSELEI